MSVCCLPLLTATSLHSFQRDYFHFSFVDISVVSLAFFSDSFDISVFISQNNTELLIFKSIRFLRPPPENMERILEMYLG